MKRVWALYRVSTENQVDVDDIPMQKNACRAFIESKNDWTLTRELSELGVSGFKKSAKDRDKVEMIRKGAVNKEFDVLLVFMYDRLGRKHEETPFIVEWFVKQGIEVWSVKEGQRTFENHVDSLTNYITFWQASGESIKTSMRVKEKLGQLNEEGGYLGGTPPFGYEVHDTGIKHVKRDKNIKDLRINKEEADLVKIMFDLVISKGYGASRIAQWLNEKGYTTRNGSGWRHNYITRILRNSIVCGYKMYGYCEEGHIVREAVKHQPFKEEYKIIDKVVFDKVQEIVSNRDLRKNDGTNAFPTKSKLLLSGIVKCGYCGSNLVADYSQKTHKRKDGLVSKWYSYRYVCKHGKDKAHGKKHDVSQYGSIKYETQVENIVKDFMARIDKERFIDEMVKFRGKTVETNKQALSKKKKEIEEDYKELSAIKGLIVKVELGQSRLSFETVESMLMEQEKKIEEKNMEIQKLEDELESNIITLDDYKRVLDELDDWTERYDKADLDSRKMMISSIIKSLHFKKDEIVVTLILPLENAVMIDKSTSDTVDNNVSSTDSNRTLNKPQYIDNNTTTSKSNTVVNNVSEWIGNGGPRLHHQLRNQP